MKHLFVLCAGLMATLTAHGQVLSTRAAAEQAIRDLQSDLQTTQASKETLKATLDQIRLARQILKEEPISDGVLQRDLLCIEDKDTSSFAMTLRDSKNLKISKVTGLSFKRRDDCDRATDQMLKVISGQAFFCAPEGPQRTYSIYALNGKTASIAQKIGFYHDWDECWDVLSKASFSRTHLSICAAPEEGAKAFFRNIYSFRDRTFERDNTLPFRSLNECQAAK